MTTTTQLLEPRLDPAEMVSIVHAFARTSAGWQVQVRFDPDDRVSVLLYADDNVDVYLSTWLPGQYSGLHDHGASATALAVVAGRLEDSRLTRTGRAQGRRLRSGRTTWSPPGVVHD